MKREEKIKIAIDKGCIYDFKDGIVRGVKGQELINKDKKGYTLVSFKYNKKVYRIRAHHFVFYFVNGWCPEMIDHKDRNRSNNHIDNLRESDCQLNMDNKGGKGYFFIEKTGRYLAQITVRYKHIYLGTYDTAEEARSVYLEAKVKYHSGYHKQ